ncbi:hypothetical protein D5O90_17400 [Salmonella enterica subsp. enterica serovar Infantis]|nr:hypothetical protein [Salmonella enterica subsp. enterica serovar Infantis]EDO5813486.1 hypothetical protein [Salmonella enterica]
MEKCALLKALFSVNITSIVLFRPAPPEQIRLFPTRLVITSPARIFLDFFPGSTWDELKIGMTNRRMRMNTS